MYQPENFNNKKPPAFPLYEPPQESISYNWNVDDMPWKTQNTKNIMMFNGVPINPDEFPSSSSSNRSIRKRKNEFVNYSPSKQHISESKMAAFLNGLHISSDYQSHNLNLDNNLDDEMESSYSVNLSPQELEERLKNAQKIVLCEDVKKTLEEKNKNEIYKVLADRIERPCQALVLWQPPKPLDKLLTIFNTKDEDDKEKDINNIKENEKMEE